MESKILLNDGVSSHDVTRFLENNVSKKMLRAYRLDWQPTEVVEETKEYIVTKKYKSAFLSTVPVKGMTYEMSYDTLYILKDVATGQKFN